MAHGPEDKANGGPGYEVEDASVKEVAFTGISLAIGTVIVCFAVAGLLKVMTASDSVRQAPVNQVPSLESFPPGPRLQEKPWEELQALRKHEEQALTTYGWVNKDSGKVRVPVDRAMDLVIQQGLPARAASGETGAAAPKTGHEESNVPTQATGFPAKGARARTNAPKQ